MACSPVGLISLMDRALCLVIAKVRVQFPAKPEFSQFLFKPLRLFIELRGLFPLSYVLSAVQNMSHFIYFHLVKDLFVLP